MPSYYDEEQKKRVTTRYHKPPVLPGQKKPINPPTTAGSYQDPETKEWKTLRRPKPRSAAAPVVPSTSPEPVDPQSKQPGETPANWYWRTRRRK